MNPEESADALSIRARGHLSGNTKVSVSIPNASLVDAEDGKVGRLDLRDVALVRDAECASFEIVWTRGVILGGGSARTDVVGLVRVLDVATL